MAVTQVLQAAWFAVFKNEPTVVIHVNEEVVG
jgi:hypothetical protein